MKDFLKSKKSLLAIAGGGLLLLLLIVKLQPDMAHDDTRRPSVPVNYYVVGEHQLRPEIIGFGSVVPDLKLLARTELSGRVTYVHPALKKGEVFAKDTLLIRIDDIDYRLQLRQAEADLLSADASLEETRLKIVNNELELELALEKLKVRGKEYARLTKLRKGGSVSQSTLEKERQNLLQQKQEVQQLRNNQTTLPSDLEIKKAQLDISQAKLERSRRDLARTKVRIPFDGRISQVYAEQDQYMTTGASLFDAFGLEKVTINAQFPIDQFRLFARNFNPDALQGDGVIPDMSSLLASFGLSATVELAGGEFEGWSAAVERFSDELDPQSKTVGVTVSVSGSYKDIQPGFRPPLIEGMYMKVRLRAAPANHLVIPRFSLHQDQVYSITSAQTLARIALTEYQLQGNLVLVGQGLKVGDRVITSDVFPAVEGMELKPELDSDVAAQMELWLGSEQ